MERGTKIESRAIHVLGTSMHGTPHTCCIVSVYVYGTQRHEVEGRLGAHGLSHGDIRGDEGGKMQDSRRGVGGAYIMTRQTINIVRSVFTVCYE